MNRPFCHSCVRFPGRFVLRVLGELVTSAPSNRAAPGRPASVDDFCALVEQAHAGSSVAFGRLLEGCRKYLLLVANASLDSDLRPKGGASDLVQDTFIEAQRDFVRFEGTSEKELLAWLKGILVHRIANHTRRYGTEKRDVDREVPLGIDPSFRQLVLRERRIGPADAAIDRDEQARLAAAIARLPEHLREVIEMRTWQGQSFSQIAARLEITSEAARKQWGRAVLRLQQDLRRNQ